MKTSKFRGAEKLIVVANILNSNFINVYFNVQNGQKLTRKMCQKSSNVDPIYSLSFFHYFWEFKYSRVVPQKLKKSFYKFSKSSKSVKKVQNGHFRVFRQSVGILRKTLLFRTTFDLGVEKSSINRHFFMFFSLLQVFNL